MKIKIFIVLGVITATAISAVLLLRSSPKPVPAGGSAGLVVGNNAIYVAEQAPSRTVSVAVAKFKKPGFVAIHEDAAGTPGKILGVSSVLTAGETKNLAPIKLSRISKDGETLYAMLHLDDGDGSFEAVKDKPVLDSVGGQPIMMVFAVSSDASEPGAVNL